MMTSERSAPSYMACFWAFIGMIVGVIIAACFCSCKSVQYVPVETIRTEIKHHHDTVRSLDSTKNDVQTVIREADSAEIERLNTEYGFKLDKAQKTILILRKELERQSHSQQEIKIDTAIIEKQVQVPYPVEKKLSKWQQTKVDWGGWAMLSALVVIILFLFIIPRWKGKRGV